MSGFLVQAVIGIVMHFFSLPFALSGLLTFLFIAELMLFDLIADLEKTTAVPTPAHLYFHMYLLSLGDTLIAGGCVNRLFEGKCRSE